MTALALALPVLAGEHDNVNPAFNGLAVLAILLGLLLGVLLWGRGRS